MASEPTICFGQQPAGFFPKRFLAAKINTAKKLRDEIGGKVVFFYHDSDADYRETITIMRDRTTGAEVRLNFTQENKLQKKFSPLYLKRIPAGWKGEILKQLPRFADKPLIDIFTSTDEKTAADFCLEMYRKMRLLERIGILRSSDKNFRQKAQDLAIDYFADIEYQGEVVRAKVESLQTPTTSPRFAGYSSLKKEERLRTSSDISDDRGASPPTKEGWTPEADGVVGVLHEGGNKFIRFPINQPIQKSQKSPNRDQRFAWMQSVINCTHYIYGEGEKEYLDISKFPDIKFIDREKIDDPSYAWLG